MNPDDAGYLYIFGAAEGAEGEYTWQGSTDGNNWSRVGTVSDNPSIFQYPVSSLSGTVLYRLTVNGVVSNTIKVTVEWYEPETQPVAEEDLEIVVEDQTTTEEEQNEQQQAVEKPAVIDEQPQKIEDFTSGDDQQGTDDFTSDDDNGLIP